jgi:hypothetical protein
MVGRNMQGEQGIGKFPKSGRDVALLSTSSLRPYLDGPSFMILSSMLLCPDTVCLLAQHVC